jgi:hypothetical protein
MKFIFAIVLFCFVCLSSSAQQQNILSVHPRVMLNYTLYTTSANGHNYKALPDGARPQLTNNIAAFAKQELVTFTDRGDSILRFWYINNTCFTQCKVVLFCNNIPVAHILCWPIGEYFGIDTKLLGTGIYRFEILIDDKVVERKDLEFGFKQ